MSKVVAQTYEVVVSQAAIISRKWENLFII